MSDAARLLVVEDDEPTRRSVVANLAAHAYDVEEAAGGAEALRRWEAQRPDLVVLDLGLPDMDGLTVVRRSSSRLASTSCSRSCSANRAGC